MSEQETPVEGEQETPEAVETPQADETVTMSKAEADALRRRVAESEKAARKLEAEQRKADEARKAEEGKWQELAAERERELNETRERAARIERDQLITRVASRLKFIDPSDVTGRLTAEDAADEQAIETSLERIAKASPHLVAKDPPAAPEIGMVHEPSATPVGAVPSPPPGKTPLRTQADVEALSQAEFDARFAEVQAVLSNA